ncbi:phosphoribosylformylglycinamidine cyclo-ligase [Candidatus Aerophobetes bacterium]|uniref:Phosphoribosylformylglycinamidine cyclo-ligase n=1 Tax=Aerophobetes bacterium TaxID=2030807 RepID=A0A662DA04_UNCAE|nr:MAG: phosphoribosylformylglycinamidine cyclo-ligase [Candidatus Aerophobetes bacterium]
MQKEKLTYKKAGVDTAREELALQYLIKWTGKTFGFKKRIGSIKLESGYFANIIDIGSGKGLAISTDGVGTKILIAQLMGKYDTVGIDCVAMNVNDIICVGAEPVSMVDYLAVTRPDPELLDQLGKGLYEGAKIAGINIPGGEVAQVKEMIKGERSGYEFDLVGTAVGLIDLSRIIIGKDIKEKDVVVGFASSGIHSNGFTLARKALFEKGKLKVTTYIPEFEKTLGEELLEPTLIYVFPVLEMIKMGIDIKALIHITGGGLLNLNRVASPVSYLLDFLPEPQPIFSLIQKTGNISDEEMFSVFNMGIGFCIVVAEKDIDNVHQIAAKNNFKTCRIGYIKEVGKKEVIIPARRLIGQKNRFLKY